MRAIGVAVSVVLSLVPALGRAAPAGLTASHERPLGEPVVARSPRASDPAVVASPAGFLVLWRDWREGPGIHAARVSLAGEVLDPVGVPLHEGETQGPLSAAAGRTAALVAWTEGEGGFRRVAARRVGATAMPMDPAPIPIAGGTGDHAWPAVAHDGTDWLVAWTERTALGAVTRARRVSEAGVPLDAGGLPLAGAATADSRPAAAGDEGEALVIWRSDIESLAARVAAGGRVLDRQPFHVLLPPAGEEPAVAARPGQPGYCLAMTTRGGQVRTSEIVRFDSGGGNLFERDATVAGARVACGASGCLAVWSSTGADGVPRLRRAPFDPRRGCTWSALAAGDEELARFDRASVACSGDTCLVVWGSEGLFGKRFRTDGSALDPTPLPVARAPGAQRSPAAAAGPGGTVLAVWEDLRGDRPGIYGARLDAGGVVLDQPAVAIAAGGPARSRPAIAWNGEGYLAAWEERREGAGRDIVAARLRPDGTPLGGAGIGVAAEAGDERAPAVAAGTAGFVVAWEEAEGADIAAVRFGWEAGRLEPGRIEISAGEPVDSSPRVAASGEGFLVAWERRGRGRYVAYARLATDGTVLDPGGVVPAGGADRAAPALAGDDEGYVLAFEDGASGIPDVAGLRVDARGLGGDPFPLSQAVEGQTLPVLILAGGGFLSAWQDERHFGAGDVFAARLGQAGGSLDGDGVAVSTEPGAERAIALAGAGPGRAVVFYERADARSAGVTRIYARALAWDGWDAPCVECDGGPRDRDGGGPDGAQDDGGPAAEDEGGCACAANGQGHGGRPVAMLAIVLVSLAVAGRRPGRPGRPGRRGRELGWFDWTRSRAGSDFASARPWAARRPG